MKKALALGLGDLFQITKSFRNSEQISPLHNPEFTMIEWYKEQAKSQDNITLTEELLSSLKRKETPPSSQGPFRVMTMEEAFKEFAGFSLEVNLEEPALKEQCLRGGLSLSEGEDWESLFHKLFLTLVEPSLPQDRPLILRDYPHRLPTLARKIPGTPWADRWELYIHGIEVANCYSEEVDPKEMEVFFLREKEIKERQAQVPVIASPRWLEGMENLPPSSGVALGVDRLILTLLNLKSIEEVLLFPLAKILL